MKLFDYEKEHIGRLRSGLAECTVLLKSNGAFPLDKPCQIAAYGSGVRQTLKGGTGSGEVNSRYFVNVEKGLKSAGFTVTTGKWLDGCDQTRAAAKKQFVKDIKKRAKKKHVMAAIEGMGPSCRSRNTSWLWTERATPRFMWSPASPAKATIGSRSVATSS